LFTNRTRYLPPSGPFLLPDVARLSDLPLGSFAIILVASAKRR
jgi:hypothetical protein